MRIMMVGGLSSVVIKYAPDYIPLIALTHYTEGQGWSVNNHVSFGLRIMVF
jgi:hypothetical protein